MSTTALEVDERTSLYRFFDPLGSLLYVGITGNVSTRLMQHDQNQPWWRLVASVTVEHYEGRGSALDAEGLAILAERPRFNKMLIHGPMIKRTYYVPAELYSKALAKTERENEDLADVIRRALREYVGEES